jgi:hypothetical protein
MKKGQMGFKEERASRIAVPNLPPLHGSASCKSNIMTNYSAETTPIWKNSLAGLQLTRSGLVDW